MSTAAPDRELPSAPAASSVPVSANSCLGIARSRRNLTIDEAARRAGLSREAVEALEQSRLYRFPSLQEAVDAAVLYSTALGISKDEARRLAGLPIRERLRTSFSAAGLIAPLALAGAIATLVWFVILPRFDGSEVADPAAGAGASGEVLLPAPALLAPLPERSEIRVDVLNGSSAGGAARRLADRVAGLAYSVGDVENAPRSDYPETRVYFTPGAGAVAERLGRELGVATQELPGGDQPRRLTVIVGAESPLD